MAEFNPTGALKKLLGETLKHIERAEFLLWLIYQEKSELEPNVRQIADYLAESGFARPNVTFLKRDLTKSQFVASGKKSGTYRINASKKATLEKRFGKYISQPVVPSVDYVLPREWFDDASRFAQSMQLQINGSFENSYYDACAVLIRRLMESLIIECFHKLGKADDIQSAGNYFDLEKLISTAVAEKKIPLFRGAQRIMTKIKKLGDTAAHDRAYRTNRTDIEHSIEDIRRVINALLVGAGYH